MRPRDLVAVKKLWPKLVHKHPKLCCKIYYYWMLKRRLHLKNPRDLNEKIQWLKFHEDMNEWARRADKYRVREYLKEKGLDNLLVKLYGKFDTGEELMEAWGSLPKTFILKSNNGCATNIVVKDKDKFDTKGLAEKLNGWLAVNYGDIPVELHYNLIKPCLIVEEFLSNPSPDISSSLIDYKIWCFNGKPYTILVCYDRDMVTDGTTLASYDTQWNETNKNLTDKTPRKHLPKPENLDLMLKYATILSEGHPQMRVDFYNLNGDIYFGELTMSSMGGYMGYYTPEFLLEMGNQVKLPIDSK